MTTIAIVTLLGAYLLGRYGPEVMDDYLGPEFLRLTLLMFFAPWRWHREVDTLPRL